VADLRPTPVRRTGQERAPDAPRVLIVEDDRKVAQALREGLAREGFDVSVETSGESAFFRLDEATYDVVLLDLGLPGRDGLQILRRLRDRGLATPVLILTARDTVSDRVLGLDSGADDYLVKPFAFAEVLARTRALVRRGRGAETPRLSAGSIDIDLGTRTVTRHGQPVALTLTEFDVLEHLVRHEGQIVSREALVHDVWRESARSTTLDNVIDVHMARLRKKLEDESAPRLIQTIRGVGFLFKGDGEPPTG
jgi:two-component system copper resistance phosphate regulon response regulator CusR